MDDAVLKVILDRLDSHPLGYDATALLLAALDGDTALATQLGGSPVPGSRPAPGDVTAPPGAYLRSVSVCGFRGVGAAATLPIEPGPGLTLVVGRNGSGKSSFAEALEVLLTGDLKRWTDHRNASVRDGWRNLHEPGSAAITAEFGVEGHGPMTVRRVWPADGAFADSMVSAQPDWGDALVTHRPFLAHSELEAFFQEPSRVHDLLLSVLGLDVLTTAAQALARARRERDAAKKAVSDQLPGLSTALEALDDERAAACAQALSGRSPDIGHLLTLTAGAEGTVDGGALDQLRHLTQLTMPSAEVMRDVVTELSESAADVSVQLGSEAGHARTLVHLLGSALRHHHTHGTRDCPVCGNPGALSDQWRSQAEASISRLRVKATVADAALSRAQAALARARELIPPPPAVLTGKPVAGIDTAPGLAAWSAWSAWPESGDPAALHALAEQLTQQTPLLSEALAALADQARAELRRRDDLWAPVAMRVAGWCQAFEEARAAAQPLPALKAAETWLKNATDDLRNTRLAPLADQARTIWSMLRQESNVDLGSIRLNGSSTRRHATVEVTVDGTPGVALSVMSQGEINALALSIFIPRATLPASPFRFLIIDDPVQAMDPAKVDGLARVLSNVAESRQVIVFTHDDRLAAAVRRLEIPARIVEITRRPGSLVEVRTALDPVGRQLDDARALCKDRTVPLDVAARVVPGLCRTAVEAAFTEAIWRAQVRAGRPYAAIEADIVAAPDTKGRAALALFGSQWRRSEVIGRLTEWDRAAASTFRQLNGAAHLGHHGDLRSLVDRTGNLTHLIRARLR